MAPLKNKKPCKSLTYKAFLDWWLFTDAPPAPESIGSYVFSILCFVLAQISIALLGYQYGRSAATQAFGSYLLRFAKVLAAVVSSVSLTLLVTRGIAEYESQISLLDQVWEGAFFAVKFALASAGGITSGFAVGFAASFNGGARGIARIAWLLIGSLVVLFSVNMYLPAFMFDAWGLPFEATFGQQIAAMANMVNSLSSEKLVDVSRNPFTASEVLALFAMAGPCYILLVWLNSLMFRTIGQRWPRLSDGWWAGLCGTASACAFAISLAVSMWLLSIPVWAITQEFRWKEIVWLRCVDARTDADRPSLAQFSIELRDSVGSIFSKTRSTYGATFISLFDPQCLDSSQRYPLARRIVGLFFPVIDHEAQLLVDDRELTLEYRSAEAREFSTLYRAPLSMMRPALNEMSNRLVRESSPYRYAWLQVASAPLASERTDSQLLSATAASTSQERAAAHSTYGYRRLQFDRNVEDAVHHLALAAQLWPDNALIASNYVLALLSADPALCAEAKNWIGAGRARLTHEAAAQWARCLYSAQGRGDEAIRFLWRNRAIHDESANYFAVLGEIALQTGRLDLASRSLDQALRLSPSTPPGCARIHKAILVNPASCSSASCTAPMSSMNAEESICWSNWMARYGHKG